MRHKIRFFVFILTILLSIQFVCGISVLADTVSPYEKIDTKLLELMEITSSSESLPVVVWMNDIEHEEIENAATAYRFEQVETAVSSISQKEFATTAELVRSLTIPVEIELDEASIRQITNDYIAYERKAHEQAYISANREKLSSIFSQSQNTFLRTVETLQPEIIYISMYSPIVLMQLTADQIYQACESNYVTGIYYNEPPSEENMEEMSVAEPWIGTDTLRESIGLDGTGIKIGMIDSGVPEKNSTYFHTNKVFYDETALDPNGNIKEDFRTAHACIMASIMVGKNDGIVPNAELYCATTKRTGGWYSGIEWLISNSVNVINISHRLDTPKATSYGITSLWLDHVAMQHSVHIVASSGNEGVNGMSEPKFAHNIITVGGVQDTEMLYASCSYSTTCYKPDLCAPAFIFVQYGDSNDEYIDKDGYKHQKYISPERGGQAGTSVSAALVTSIVAQLCQRNSTLLVCQDAMKSILLAGTTDPWKTSATGELSNIAMEYGWGAGILNAENSYYVLNYARWRNLSFAATSGARATYTTTFDVSSSDTFIRVALSWLNTARLSNDISHASQTSPSSYTLEKLCLNIIGPNGAYWTSYETTGNVQVIAFDPRDMGGTGTYTIQVTRMTDYDTKIYFGLAWY